MFTLKNASIALIVAIVAFCLSASIGLYLGTQKASKCDPIAAAELRGQLESDSVAWANGPVLNQDQQMIKLLKLVCSD